MEFRDVIRSTVFWWITFTVMLFLFWAYGARPVLHVLGLFFALIGGRGLEGTGL